MLGLGLSIALLISSVLSANEGDPILVAAQLIAAAIFYVGAQLVLVWSKLGHIEDNLVIYEDEEASNGTEREVC